MTFLVSSAEKFLETFGFNPGGVHRDAMGVIDKLRELADLYRQADEALMAVVNAGGDREDVERRHKLETLARERNARYSRWLDAFNLAEKARYELIERGIEAYYR